MMELGFLYDDCSDRWNWSADRTKHSLQYIDDALATTSTESKGPMVVTKDQAVALHEGGVVPIKNLTNLSCLYHDGYYWLKGKLDGKDVFGRYGSNEVEKKRVEEIVAFFQPTKGTFMKDIFTDIKGFIKTNNTIIYWIALIFLADHFFFNGAFRERLRSLVNSLIGKVEEQVGAITKKV